MIIVVILLFICSYRLKLKSYHSAGGSVLKKGWVEGLTKSLLLSVWMPELFLGRMEIMWLVSLILLVCKEV